nr:MAG TPA: hypothetical protein [Caudoviricetes sp.]
MYLIILIFDTFSFTSLPTIINIAIIKYRIFIHIFFFNFIFCD